MKKRENGGVFYHGPVDYVVIKRGVAIDTICRVDNIADLCVSNHIITIGFYGQVMDN